MLSFPRGARLMDPLPQVGSDLCITRFRSTNFEASPFHISECFIFLHVQQRNSPFQEVAKPNFDQRINPTHALDLPSICTELHSKDS